MYFNAILHTLYVATFLSKNKNLKKYQIIHFCNTFFNHENNSQNIFSHLANVILVIPF